MVGIGLSVALCDSTAGLSIGILRDGSRVCQGAGGETMNEENAGHYVDIEEDLVLMIENV